MVSLEGKVVSAPPRHAGILDSNARTQLFPDKAPRDRMGKRDINAGQLGLEAGLLLWMGDVV